MDFFRLVSVVNRKSKNFIGSLWDRKNMFLYSAYDNKRLKKIKLGTATQKFTISTNIQHVPANHTSQAHFHGEVIGAGLIIIYVWQQVFARLHSDRRRAILLFLQTRLFRGVHLTQVNPDLFFQEDRKSTF